MTCDECGRLLAAHAMDSLDDHGAEVEAHLRDCQRCRMVAAAHRTASNLLPLALEPVKPSAALRSRLLAQVHAEAAGEQRGSVRAPRLSSRVRLWQAVPASHGLTTAGGLTAVAGVALAAWWGFVHHAPAAPPVVLVSHACGLIPLPSACGELSYTPRGRQAVLTVHGMPAPPVVNNQATGVYEVWLMRPNGSAQPVAYLTRAPGGTSWTAVIEGDISGSTMVATTLESDAGHPVPSGPEVLAITTPHPPAG